MFDGAEGLRYERRELLGSGGMGRVVLARDHRFDRDVALKEVPPGLDAAYTARLAREAAIAARLDHPGIVPVHDAGRHPDGTAFFAMRVVRGRSLAELLRDPDVPRERLFRAVLAASEAVGWAHAMGVVHRDLKPANIMVGEFGETQVVDWGLARDGVSTAPGAPRKGTIPGVIEPAESTSEPALTRAGTVVGTPQYMAPEQAQGLHVDPRSDVFSLGAVLFELVAQRPPHDGAVPDEVLAAAAFRAPPRLLSVVPDAPAELAAIVDKALARVPDLRYPNGKALADDLARYLDGRRVAAHTYSRTELLRRVWRAWRIPIIAGALSFVAVAAATIVAFQTTRAGRERAERAEATARAAADSATAAEAATRKALAAADDNLARALAAQAIAQPQGARPEAEVLAVHALKLRESPLARGLLAAWEAAPRPALATERAIPAACAHPLVGPEGELACREGIALPLRRTSPAYRAAWNGGYLKVASDAGEWTTKPCPGATLGAVAFDDLGRRWAAFCVDGQYVTGSLDQQMPSTAPAQSGRVSSPLEASAAAFIPHTDHVVVGTNRGFVARVDLSTGSLLQQVKVGDGAVFDVDVSSDGALGAALGDRGGVVLWDVAAGQVLHRLPTHWARALRFASADARLLWTVGPTIRGWRLPEARAVTIDAGGGVTSVVARAGVVGITTGKGVLLVDAGTGAVRWRRDWPAGTVKHGTFLSDARFVATNAGDTALRSWDVTTGADAEVLVNGEPARGRRVATAMTHGGPVVLVATYDGTLHAVENTVATLLLRGNFMDLAVSANGRSGAVLREDPREVCRLAIDDAVRVGTCHAVPGAVSVAVPDDGVDVLVARAHAVDAIGPGGDVVARYPIDAEAGGHLGEIEVSADGRFVAAGDGDGTTWIWRTADQRLMARIRDHQERVTGVAFDTDGRLWTGSWDGTVRVRSLDALEAPVETLRTRIDAAWGLSLDRVVDAR